MLLSQKLSGAAETCLDLVQHQHHVVAGTYIPHCFQVTVFVVKFECDSAVFDFPLQLANEIMRWGGVVIDWLGLEFDLRHDGALGHE